jgi:hypothetical protein
LVATAPGIIESDSSARPYSFMALLLLLAVVCLWNAMRTAQPRWLAAWVAIVVMLLYSHNWTVLPVAGMAAWAFVHASFARTQVRFRTLIVGYVAILLLWGPWLPSLLAQSRHGGQLPMPSNPIVALPAHLLSSLPGVSTATGVLLAIGLIVTLSVRRDTSASEPNWLPAAGWMILGALVLATAGSFRTNLLVPHTLVMLGPVVLLFVAANLFTRSSPRRPLALGALLLSVSLNVKDSLRLAVAPRSSVDTIARTLSSEARAGDLIVLVPGDLVLSFERHYTGTAPTFPYPDGTSSRPFEFDHRIARDTTVSSLSESRLRIREVIESGGRVWHVWAGTHAHLAGPWQEFVANLNSLAGRSRPVDPAPDAMPGTREAPNLRVWGPVALPPRPGNH